MDNPRPEKVATVAELGQRFDDASAVLLTEYRGLDVPALAELRGELRKAGAEYKIYKNTLVRIAARNAGLDLDALLTGPTAVAFVTQRADGSDGDPSAVAKALRDFVKTHDALVLKGGVVDGNLVSVDQLKALADLPSRDVLLAQIAGALAAPMQKFAGLLQALPRDFAYGLKALIDTKPAAEAAPEADEAPAAEAAPEADEAATDDTPSPAAEATTEETPADAGSEQES